MPIWGKSPSGWQNITNPFINVSGAWRTVINGWNNVGGTWRRCFGNPLVVSVSTPTTYGLYVNSSGIAGMATSTSVTCTVTGATGSVTYSWVRISGDSITAATTPSSASTQWVRSGTPPSTYNSSWACNVVDSAGNMGQSPPVSVNMLFYL